MIVEDQGEVIAFLSRPQAYGSGASAVERLETHVSVIFLTGDRAYKLKRAVRFPYLDFSTSALRRAACEAEVALNRRTAPGMYLGVVAVTREPGGGLRLGGDGAPVDWLVKMTRFDQDTLFDHLARLGALDRAAMEDLADAVARLHGEAEERVRGGGHAGMGVIVDGNAETFAECANGVLDPVKVERLNGSTRRALDGCAALLDARRAGGRVRHCHGDLHLRNIFRTDGKPTLFDAIEFNPVLSDIDVLYDLAFLLMDLDHRGLRRLASIALNRYLDITGDTAGLGALGLFLSVRAAIRSHVEAAAARPSSARRVDTFSRSTFTGSSTPFAHSAKVSALLSTITPMPACPPPRARSSASPWRRATASARSSMAARSRAPSRARRSNRVSWSKRVISTSQSTGAPPPPRRKPPPGCRVTATTPRYMPGAVRRLTATSASQKVRRSALVEKSR